MHNGNYKLKQNLLVYVMPLLISKCLQLVEIRVSEADNNCFKPLLLYHKIILLLSKLNLNT